MNRRQPGPARTIAAAIAAVLTAAAPVASANDAGAGDAGAEFRRLDANRDGYVSRDEARRIKGFEKAFQQADDNRDGKLDADEFAKAQAVHDRVRAGRYLDDSVITAKVKAALLRDPIVSAFAVSVETYKGIVLLSGFVRDRTHARRAAEIAASVQGVVTVKNALTTKS
jgi:hyperosmotically inducible periplasmic protein